MWLSCDWYLTRLQVLVTTVCSETFIVGPLQKCLSCYSSGHCTWDLRFSLALYIQTCTDLITHASLFLLELPHPSKVQCIGVTLYRQWSVISESEYTKAEIWLLKLQSGKCKIIVQILS